MLSFISINSSRYLKLAYRKYGLAEGAGWVLIRVAKGL